MRRNKGAALVWGVLHSALCFAPQSASGADSAAEVEAIAEVAEVEVIVSAPPVQVERATPLRRLNREEIGRAAGAFGDAFRAIEGLPGVSPLVSGVPYFQLRGAPLGTVGYYVDEVPVPLVFHYGLGPSVLQPAFLGSVDVFPGAYPVPIGNWVGGTVVGNTAPLSDSLTTDSNWTARLLDVAGVVETPVLAGQGQLKIGGRYAYPGLLVSLVDPDMSLGYWDYQLQTRYFVGSRGTFEIFGFGAGDHVTRRFASEVGQRVDDELLQLGFHRLDVRYSLQLDNATLELGLTGGTETSRLADTASTRSALAAGRVRMQVRVSERASLTVGVTARLEDIKQHFNVESTTQSTDSAGMDVFGSKTPDPGDPRFPLKFGSRVDTTSGAFAALRWAIHPRLTLTPGLRTDVYTSATSTRVAFEPRLNANYRLTNATSVFYDLGVAHQRPSFGPPLPGFVPILDRDLQRVYQTAATVSSNLTPEWTLETTLFQHWFAKTTDYLGVPQPEQNMWSTGHSYGVEVGAKKRLTDWFGATVAYSFTHATRAVGRFSGLAATNRNHVANVGMSFDLGSGWLLNSRAIGYSGIWARGRTRGRLDKMTSPFWRVDWRLEKRWAWMSRSISFVAEVLNTTANSESIGWDCLSDSCEEELVGPVVVPNIGLSGKF